MGAPVVLGLLSVDFFWPSPAFWSAQYKHWPEWTLRATSICPRFDSLNLFDDRIERCSHELVHLFRVVAFDKVRRVAVASEEMLQLLVTDASEYTGICDLVTIEVENRQDDAVINGV